MGGLFRIDGPVYKFGSVLADIFMVSLLWIIFSIPLITIGTSTTAAYYVFTKRVEGKDSYIIKGFVKSYRENLRQTIIAFLILVAGGSVVWLNFQLLDEVGLGSFILFVQLALTVVAVQLTFITMFIFPILARFEMTLLGAFKASFQMANKHLFFSISNVILAVAILFVTEIIPFLIIFIMGIYLYLSSFGFVRVFKKNKPDF